MIKWKEWDLNVCLQDLNQHAAPPQQELPGRLSGTELTETIKTLQSTVGLKHTNGLLPSKTLSKKDQETNRIKQKPAKMGD
jgi:hypothetical protein